MSPERLENLPQHQGDEPDGHHVQRDPPDRGLCQLVKRALAGGGATPVAERQPEGQPGQDQMHNAEGDEPDADRVVQPLAVVRTPTRLLGLH